MTASKNIAGHHFIDTVNGRLCSICNRRWAEIMGATREHIKQSHWAHIGYLTESELQEIEAERDRIWGLVEDACKQ